MSTLVPFPARIVRPEWAEHVVSPMHDALSREERAEMLADRPYAWLHVSRTPDDAPEGQEVDPAALDEANVAALRRLLDADLFEDSPNRPSTSIACAPRTRGRHRRGGGSPGIRRRSHPRARSPARARGRARAAPFPARRSLDPRGVDVPRRRRRAEDRAGDDRGGSAPTVPPGDLEQTVWRIDDRSAVETIRERLDHHPLHHGRPSSGDGLRRALSERAGRPNEAGVPVVLFPDEELRMLASTAGSWGRSRSTWTSSCGDSANV